MKLGNLFSSEPSLQKCMTDIQVNCSTYRGSSHSITEEKPGHHPTYQSTGFQINPDFSTNSGIKCEWLRIILETVHVSLNNQHDNEIMPDGLLPFMSSHCRPHN